MIGCLAHQFLNTLPRLPEFIDTELKLAIPGSVVGVYNGKQYITVEIKPVEAWDSTSKHWASSRRRKTHNFFSIRISYLRNLRRKLLWLHVCEEMIGHYLGEFSITYKPIKHGRAGMMSKNSQFVPLKWVESRQNWLEVEGREGRWEMQKKMRSPLFQGCWGCQQKLWKDKKVETDMKPSFPFFHFMYTLYFVIVDPALQFVWTAGLEASHILQSLTTPGHVVRYGPTSEIPRRLRFLIQGVPK